MNQGNLKVRILKHYLVLSVIIIISAICLYIFRGKRDTITFIAWSSGYISFVLLALSLITGSVNILMKRSSPVSTYFRRDLGIMAGTLAILHSVSGLFVHLRGKMWMYFLNKSHSGYSLRFDDFGIANYTGLIAAILILILILTSNDRVMIRLTQGRWKNIQRLSYLMFIMVLIHAYFYWVGGRNTDILILFYVPLILIVISMQSAGMIIRKHRTGRN
jgi:sulfoxide reductase heme-binding subunit YedZ